MLKKALQRALFLESTLKSIPESNLKSTPESTLESTPKGTLELTIYKTPESREDSRGHSESTQKTCQRAPTPMTCYATFIQMVQIKVAVSF